MYEETLASDKIMVELAADFIVSDQHRLLASTRALSRESEFASAVSAGDAGAMLNRLEALHARTGFDPIVVLDESNRELLRWKSPGEPQPGEPVKEAAVPPASLPAEPAWLTMEVKGGVWAGPVIVCSSPILDSGGRRIGALVGFQPVRHWSAFLARLTKHRKELTFHLLYERRVIAQSQPDPGRAALVAQLAGDASTGSEGEEGGGSELIRDIDTGALLFLSTARVPELGWRLAMVHDYRKVMAPMDAMVRNIGMFMTILLVLLGFIGAALYRRYEERKVNLEQAGGEVVRLEKEVRIQAENLRISTERYTQLVRGLPDIIFETRLDGRVIAVSKSINEVLGIGAESITAREWTDRVHPEDRAAFQRAWSLSSNRTDFSIPALRYVKAGGEIRYLTLFFIPWFDSSGELTGWNGVARDVTSEIESSRRVRQLNRQLIQGQEEERRRLALDLHDEMGQVLSALKIGLQSLLGEGLASDDPIRSEIEKLIELTQTIMNRIRTLSYSLHPAILDNFGLQAAIEDLCETCSEASGVDVHFRSSGFGEERLTWELKTAVFRFVQEALTNAVKHSGSPVIDVDLGMDADIMIVRVQDQGRGFDVERTLTRAPMEKKLGLWGMNERIGMLGGRLDIVAGATGAALTAKIKVES